MSRVFAAAAAACFVFAAGTVSAQTHVGGEVNVTQFKDTSMLKPPPGQKVAIIVWEDLECPACAHAFPIVHVAANHYHIPIVRYDFPLQMHIWSRQAAVIARYIQDKISPQLAEEYRREVFASQYQIASKDDLQKFTQQFFQKNGKQLPFVLDPTGQFAKEVGADEALALKANLNHTPTIVVVTPKQYIEVTDVSALYTAIDQAEASAAHEAPEAAKRTTAVRKTHK